MKVARSSGIIIGRFKPPQEIFLVFISVSGRVDPRAMVRPEGIRQRKMFVSNTTPNIYDLYPDRIKNFSPIQQVQSTFGPHPVTEDRPLSFIAESMNA